MKKYKKKINCRDQVRKNIFDQSKARFPSYRAAQSSQKLYATHTSNRLFEKLVLDYCKHFQMQNNISKNISKQISQ